jgi:hypothetical protein
MQGDVLTRHRDIAKITKVWAQPEKKRPHRKGAPFSP